MEPKSSSCLTAMMIGALTPGKCRVHSLKNYAKPENVGAENYYCRFEYKADIGELAPDIVAVHCKCEMPYNPDELMVKCEGCWER
ncbi:hypothetical protein Pyn_22602 [Prunus yedoensis var. nudiflora]|uniref:Uncharacterized protein n=1 Tax=Prunus yedoensis var. nudiflora TaxID=2094558 RepID=A0A314ZRV6_PRUYE|nr:hypothetical protein Pyn_22602 [Prunus yedoensis var. nudiflora]